MRADALQIIPALIKIEINMRQQVSFVDAHAVCMLEYGGIFKRLLLAFSHAQQNNFQVFPDIKRRRAHQVAYVFNKQDISLYQGEGF